MIWQNCRGDSQINFKPSLEGSKFFCVYTRMAKLKIIEPRPRMIDSLKTYVSHLSVRQDALISPLIRTRITKQFVQYAGKITYPNPWVERFKNIFKVYVKSLETYFRLARTCSIYIRLLEFLLHKQIPERATLWEHFLRKKVKNNIVKNEY